MIELATERFHRLRKRRLADRLRDRDFEITFAKRNEPQPMEETPVNTHLNKAERIRSWRAEVEDAAKSYAAEHSVPVHVARDIVVSSRHKLEKLDRDHVLNKVAAQSPPPGTREGNWPSKPGADLPRGGAMSDSRYNAQQPWPFGISFDEWLSSLVRTIGKANPQMSKSKAYDTAMAQPNVKQAMDYEKNQRLLAATRLYGDVS